MLSEVQSGHQLQRSLACTKVHLDGNESYAGRPPSGLRRGCESTWRQPSGRGKPHWGYACVQVWGTIGETEWGPWPGRSWWASQWMRTEARCVGYNDSFGVPLVAKSRSSYQCHTVWVCKCKEGSGDIHVLGDAGAEAQDSQGGARQYHLHQEGSLADLPICLLHVHLALGKPTTNHLFVGSKGHPIKHVKLIRWLAGHPPKPPHTHWPEADRCHRSCTAVWRDLLSAHKPADEPYWHCPQKEIWAAPWTERGSHSPQAVPTRGI